MLETIKAYAAAQLDAQPEFAAAAREQPRRATSPSLQRSAGAPTDATTSAGSPDLDNLRIAWAPLGRPAGSRAGSTTLREALWPIYEARGWYHAMIQLADDLLAVQASSPERPDRLGDAELSLRTGRARAMTLLRGYTAEAEDAYAEALALVKEHGEVPQLFPVLRNLASFHGYRGEFDKGDRVRDARSSGSPMPRTTRACGSTATRSARREQRVHRATSSPASATSTRRSRRSRAATTGRAGCGSGSTRACRA